MAKDFIEYLKETAGSIFNNKENEEKRKKALEDLNTFLEETAKSDKLPERPDLSEQPEYERLSYEEKSGDQLKELAQSTLEEYKNNSVSAIEKEIELLAKKLDAEKSGASSAAESKQESLESAYGIAKKETDDDMLRRGLARSSIAVNKNATLSEAKADESFKIAAALNDAIAALDAEIATLGAQREKALSDFNISYAAKLTEKINELTDAQEKNKAEVVKYNNSLAEKEYEAGISAKEKEASIYGKELDNTEKERALSQDADPYQATYNKMCEILDELNGAEARELVMENPIFRDNLSDYYYYKLYDKYTR